MLASVASRPFRSQLQICRRSKMFLKSILIIGIALYSLASAHVIREAPQTFTGLVDTAENNWKELEKTFLKAVGVENTDQLEDKILTQGKGLATQLDQWANDVKKQTEDLKDNSAIKELRASVDKAIDEFKLKHPDTAEDMKNYVEKANKGTEEIISKMKGLSESEEAKNIKDLSGKLLDAAASTFQNISKQILEEIKQK